MKNRGVFVTFAAAVASGSGNPAAFIIAIATIVVWGLSGPVFRYSDTWQLVINTSTTIITFIMVFLIQNTQNRDSRAVQLKLDELIRATDGAHTVLLDLEQLSERELRAISCKYVKIAEEARSRLRAGQTDTDIPEVILDSDPDLQNKND